MPSETNITKFIAAYLVTALWSSNDESREDGGDPLDDNYTVADISPGTLATMSGDCRNFLAEAGETIEAAIETGEVVAGPDFDAWGRAGHDFWLTRNGHGAGFWDGDWPEPFAATLTDAAHAAGETNLFVNDDGQVWQA